MLFAMSKILSLTVAELTMAFAFFKINHKMYITKKNNLNLKIVLFHLFCTFFFTISLLYPIV